MNDHELSALLATEAGELLVGLRAEMTASGAEASELKDRGDRESHVLLMKRLAELAPNDAVLSEEGADDHARLTSSRVWIVDPVDGTREFSEPPRTDWAVHVAMAVDGVPVAGAVALPALGITLGTGDGPVDLPPIPERPRIVVSRTRPPEQTRTASSSASRPESRAESAGSNSPITAAWPASPAAP